MSIISYLKPLFNSYGPKQRGESSGVLIVSSGGIGDTVLFSLVFRRFARLAKEGEPITLLLRENATKVGFLFGKNVSIYALDYERFAKDRSYRKSTCQYLYDSNFRLVVSTDFLRHPKKDDLLVQACKASEVLAMEPRSWPKYDRVLQKNRSLYDRLYDSGPVVLDKIVRWTGFANWLTDETLAPPQVKLPPEISPATVAGNRPTVILVPFSAVKEKQPPASLFSAIVEIIPKHHDIVIACAPGEFLKNRNFDSLLHLSNVRLDESSLENLLPVLQAARLVVSVDTATMHLAVAAGARTLCLASAAYVGEIIPYAPQITPKNVYFIYTPMECQGCLGNCIHSTENGMFPCVSRINQREVLAKVLQLLDDGKC